MSQIESPQETAALCASCHHPRFAAFYEWMTQLGSFRRMTEPLRRKLIGHASGIVLEVGAGNGLNFSYYLPERCTRVDAIEPDPAMLRYARSRLKQARVPITLTSASIEALPFADQTFDSVVITLVLCSVADPLQGLREIQRVLKPGGTLLLVEHVRSDSKATARIQDWLVPLTTRCFGNCHWNRDTVRILKDADFHLVRYDRLGGGLEPIIMVEAVVAA